MEANLGKKAKSLDKRTIIAVPGLLIIGAIVGFVEGLAYVIFNLYQFLALNLQVISALALTYFAIKQHQFSKREYKDPNFKIIEGEKALDASFSHDLADIDVEEVYINLKIENEGPGDVEKLSLEKASVGFEATDNQKGWYSASRGESFNVSEEVPGGRKKKGQVFYIAVPLSNLSFQEANIIEHIENENVDLKMNSIVITLESDKGVHHIGTENIESGLRDRFEKKLFGEEVDPLNFLDSQNSDS